MPHIHEKIDFTVEVFIVYKDKVLLRMHDKFKQWLSVGGHIELDEDPIQAAHREVKEEAGLKIELIGNKYIAPGNTEQEGYTDLLPPIGLIGHQVTPSHRHITFIYFARAQNNAISKTHMHDGKEECRWFTKEELQKTKLWSDVREYALLALAMLGEKK